MYVVVVVVVTVQLAALQFGLLTQLLPLTVNIQASATLAIVYQQSDFE